MGLATFNAPLGGVVFAIELLLISIDARNVLLAATATSIATCISRLLLCTYTAFFIPAFRRDAAVDVGCVRSTRGPHGLLSVALIRGIYAGSRFDG
jgi:chloride channel protein, CIC family